MKNRMGILVLAILAPFSLAFADAPHFECQLKGPITLKRVVARDPICTAPVRCMSKRTGEVFEDKTNAVECKSENDGSACPSAEACAGPKVKLVASMEPMVIKPASSAAPAQAPGMGSKAAPQ